RIGEARRDARLFTRNRAHRHVGWRPKGRLVNHDERRPYRPGEPGPSLGFWSHIEAQMGTQLSGPIAGFLACVEDAQRLRLPSAPSPRRGPTGLHRTQFRNPNRKSRKREKGKRSEAECFFCCANLVARESYSQFVSFVWFSWH